MTKTYDIIFYFAIHTIIIFEMDTPSAENEFLNAFCV